MAICGKTLSFVAWEDRKGANSTQSEEADDASSFSFRSVSLPFPTRCFGGGWGEGLAPAWHDFSREEETKWK